MKQPSCEIHIARIRANFWELCEIFMTPAEFGDFWTTGRLPRPIRHSLDKNLVDTRLQALRKIKSLHLELLGREPTDAEQAAILDPADQLFALPDGSQLPKTAAFDFFHELARELAAVFDEELSHRHVLQFATTRTLPVEFDFTPERMKAATLRLDLMTETITRVRQAPPSPEDWLALHQLAWPPAVKPPQPNLHDAPEPTELIRQLWRTCEARLEPGELAAYWKNGTPPPNCDPRLEDSLAAVRTLTLQTIDALYKLARVRPVDEAERLYRSCLFQCGPTVVDNYMRVLGREPTTEELDDIMDPENHLFCLPDGVAIRIDRAATFFPDLEEAAEGDLTPEALLRFVVRGPTPETTAGLPPKAVQSMTERLQEMRTLITEARNAPPVLADWLALQDLGRGFR